MLSLDGRGPADSPHRTAFADRQARQRAVLACALRLLSAFRGGTLRVHALTSPVAFELTANALLALGIRPTLTSDPATVGDFVRNADGLLINLGMLEGARKQAIPIAIEAAHAARKPVVLDPVHVELSPARAAFARSLADDLAQGAAPGLVKGNAREMAALALDPARLTVTTGAVDEIAEGRSRYRIGNGHPLMDKVTAMGCAGGAVLAGALALDAEAPAVAAAASMAILGLAGEMAGALSAGPGTFRAHFLDALATLDEAALTRGLRCE